MSHHRKTSNHEHREIPLAPIDRSRPEPNPADTDSIESREALAWLVRQLKWERTLEVLRTQGPAPRPTERAAA